ncbi:unnamed protein product [Rhodiola kirilowii]
MCSKASRKSRMRSRKSKQASHRRVGILTEGRACAVKKEEVAAARKVRTRIRKPRYVSLTRLDRMVEEAEMVEEEVVVKEEMDDEMEMKLIELFPMRTAAAEDVSRISDYFFSEECDTSTSLTGLLDSEAISVSVAVSPVFEGVEKDEKLVRAALRSREREESEEKWVSYSEVVEDVSSSAVDGCGTAEEERRKMKRKRLSLKLDYQEVLDAWDGGRSLFVSDVNGSQIVPGFDDELFAGDSNDAWLVPDQKAKRMIKEEEINGNWEEDELKWKMGQIREASLLRYKEKRRNRLFSKRIRYEVRKLNAEKRPRIKGRFVKRD